MGWDLAHHWRMNRIFIEPLPAVRTYLGAEDTAEKKTGNIPACLSRDFILIRAMEKKKGNGSMVPMDWDKCYA